MKTLVSIYTNSESPAVASLLGMFLTNEKDPETYIPELLPLEDLDPNLKKQQFVRRDHNPQHLRAEHNGFVFRLDKGETHLEGYKRMRRQYLENELGLHQKAIKLDLDFGGIREQRIRLEVELMELDKLTSIEVTELPSVFQIEIEGEFKSEHRVKLTTAFRLMSEGSNFIVYHLKIASIETTS